MGTRILRAEVIGTRNGTREQPTCQTNPKRYAIYNGKSEYLYSETRYHAFSYNEYVSTQFSTVKTATGQRFEFDTGYHRMSTGDTAYVAQHSVLLWKITDLFENGHGFLAADGPDPFRGEVDTTVPGILALLVGGASYKLGVETWHAVAYGCYSGVGLFVAHHALYAYGTRMLALLRWKAKRTVNKLRAKAR